MRKSLFVVALLTLALGACASAPSPRPSYGKAISAELAAEKACANWRRIALKSSGAAQCPQVPGWNAAPLFVEQARRVAARQKPYQPTGRYAAAAEAADERDELSLVSVEAVEEELARFCVYETDRAAAPFPDLSGIEDVDEDCAAVAPAATWDPFAERLLAEAGRPAVPLVIKNHRGVRLAFLDTQKTAARMPIWPSKSRHGYTLAHIARHLVCSPATSQACAAQITTRLALPIRQFDSERRRGTKVARKRGGGIGTQTDLANAIVDEIDAWRGELGRPGAPEHLVLNISLAWDPTLIRQLEAGELKDLSAGSQAVYQALQYARSHKVLVVAAAGNRTECNPNGPLLPAAWEGNAPPDCAGCGPSSPLLYAVGGVRADGTALLNARVDGMARRSAYGEDAVVSTTWHGHSTWGYTGSSVSTAVVSSIAALVWDSFPKLGPHQVMEIVDRSGEPLALQASFGFSAGMPPPPIRHVSLCRALREACDAHPGKPCPLQDRECETPPEAARTYVTEGTLATSQSCHPWLVPQPEELPCPPCGPPGG